MPIGSRQISRRGLSPSVIKGAFHDNPWGRTLYVQSTHTRASDDYRAGQDFRHPLKTIARAIALAQPYDLIVVGPGHAESVIAADGLNFSVANVRVVGLGHAGQRPTITFTTATTARAKVSAAGVTIENLVLACGVDSLAEMLLVDAADCTLRDVHVAHDATNQAVLAINVTSNGDYLLVEGLTAAQAAAGATACISLNGCDRATIQKCRIYGDYSAACIRSTGVAVTQVRIDECHLESLNAADACIVMLAASTGWISRNMCRIATDVQTTWISGANCQLSENYGVNDNGETGKLIGTASI